MNQAASYWSSVPHHHNFVPGQQRKVSDVVKAGTDVSSSGDPWRGRIVGVTDKTLEDGGGAGGGGGPCH